MKTPIVSFVIPCYKLAHLLPECVRSILSQTFEDLEILIMDDCSPDNTAEVGSSFTDARVRVVRNESNLGALRNYNKGIALSRGKYIWLISADDYLRRSCVVRRYVDLMEAHPSVGYTFCPGIGVRAGEETNVLGYSVYGNRDRVVDGQVFLRTLLNYNKVLAPSAMARRECYERISYFPLDVVWAETAVDMIWGGDWYLWLAFALQWDVGYFAEPMVCYREHDGSMTNAVTQEKLSNCLAADLAVPWLIKKRADALGLRPAARACLKAIANEYGRQCTSKRYQWMERSNACTISMDEFERSLCKSTDSAQERDWIRARVYAHMGAAFQAKGKLLDARRYYRAGLSRDPWMARLYAKLLRLYLAGAGGEAPRVSG